LTGVKRSISYGELLAEVQALAAVLREHGVGKGDRVVLYLPMIPEAAIAMLACARLGAIHSVVFGGFAAPELAARIDDARPKVVISASCGIEPGRKSHVSDLRGPEGKSEHRISASFPTSRSSTRRSRASRTSPMPASSCSAL